MQDRNEKKVPPPQRDLHANRRFQDTRTEAQIANYRAVLTKWISETLPGANWPEAGSGMVAMTRCLSCDAPEAAAIDTACYPAEVRCQSCRLAVDLPAYLKAHGWPAPPPYPARHEMLTPPRERRLDNDCY